MIANHTFGVDPVANEKDEKNQTKVDGINDDDPPSTSTSTTENKQKKKKTKKQASRGENNAAVVKKEMRINAGYMYKKMALVNNHILIIILLLLCVLVTQSTQSEVPFCRLLSPNECIGKRRVFVERFGKDNPFHGLPVPNRARVVHHDFDADGDIDLLIGGQGRLWYYKNVGTSTRPKYSRLSNIESPVGWMSSQLSGYSSFDAVVVPVLFDLDDDGDMDFILFGRSGCATGPHGAKYYENIGNTTTPWFQDWNLTEAEKKTIPTVAEQAWVFPINGKNHLVGNQFASSEFHFYQNVGGNPTRFVLNAAANPLRSFFSVCQYATFTSFDMDNDGDNDVVSGCSIGAYTYLENTGSRSNPVFTERRGVANPLSSIAPGMNVDPTGFDVDGDGDIDIVVGQSSGGLRYLENTSPLDLEYSIHLREADENVFSQLTFTQRPTPCLVDFDGDPTTLEFLVGGQDGYLSYVKNQGVPLRSNYVTFGSDSNVMSNPLFGIHVDSYSAPGAWDVDGDNDQDVVIVSGNGVMMFAENVGNITHSRFLVRNDSLNPFSEIQLGANTQFSPSGVDLDADGDIDLIAGTMIGHKTLRYWENTGTNTQPLFVEKMESENPFLLVRWDACCSRTSMKQALHDWDKDGDLDLILTGGMGYFYFYENIGNATNPTFTDKRSQIHPLSHVDVGTNAAFAIADLDGEGDPDFVVGVSSSLDKFFTFTSNGCQHASPCSNNGICVRNLTSNSLTCSCYADSASGKQCQHCPR